MTTAAAQQPPPPPPPPPPCLSEDELCAMARRAVLSDFARQCRYRQLQRDIVREQRQVQMIAPPAATASQLRSTTSAGDNDDALVRASSVRTLHEYTTVTRQLYMRQLGLYGTAGMLTLATVGAAWVGVARNRVALLVVPLTAGLSWQVWSRLEATWEVQRYYNHAAQLRASRAHDPARDAVVVTSLRKRPQAATMTTTGAPVAAKDESSTSSSVAVA